MHGLFDHGSVFSVVLQIISKRGGNYLWHGSPLSQKRTQDYVDSLQRATVGTTANCRSHKKVTDTGRLHRDYCDKKSCRCWSTRREGKGGGNGAKLVSEPFIVPKQGRFFCFPLTGSLGHYFEH